MGKCDYLGPWWHVKVFLLKELVTHTVSQNISLPIGQIHTLWWVTIPLRHGMPWHCIVTSFKKVAMTPCPLDFSRQEPKGRANGCG